MLNFNQEFIAKYSLRNPSHPYIEILRNSDPTKDTLHQLIYQQIQLVYNRTSVATATTLFKPVFIYTFLEASDYKHLLASVLIEKLLADHLPDNQKNNGLLTDLIAVYFSHLRTKDLNQTNTLTAIHNLVKLWSTDQVISKLTVKFIVDLLIRIDQAHSLNCSFEWDLLIDLIKTRPNLINEYILFSLAANLSKIGLNNFESYLQFVHECVIGYQGSIKLAIAVFIPSLFDYLIALYSLEVHQRILSDGYKSKIVMLLAKFTDLIQSQESKLSYLPIDSTQTTIFNLIGYEGTNF